jgi:SNF2 family DNA or RNA helicase
VGYGKTCITLAAIDSNPATESLSETCKFCESGYVHTEATLVVVPTHLMGKWPQEVEKFLGKSSKKVVMIKNMASLNKIRYAGCAS